MSLIERAQQVLHVVTHLMGNDVSIRKVTIGPQLTLHLGEEREVDVQFLVTRAIEGAHRTAGLPTGRRHTVREQHQRGRRVLAAHLLEDLGPDVLGRSQNLTRELGQGLFLLGKLALTLDLFLLDGRQPALLYHVADYVAQVSPVHQGHQGHNDDTCQASEAGLCATAHAAAVFHVRAFSASSKFHTRLINICIILYKGTQKSLISHHFNRKVSAFFVH